MDKHDQHPDLWEIFHWGTHPGVVLLALAYLWTGFFYQTPGLRGEASTFLLLQYLSGDIWGIATVVVAVWLGFTAARVASAVVWALFLILINFSYLYWSHGAPPDFNHTLSHLDAIYFAVGTLTTAGTGSLEAMSETARELQLFQMVLGFALIAFAVSVAVTRFASRLDRPPTV